MGGEAKTVKRGFTGSLLLNIWHILLQVGVQGVRHPLTES